MGTLHSDLTTVRLPFPDRLRLRWLAAWGVISKHADGMALAGLMGAALLVAANRIAYPSWLLRFDLFTQIIPWYHELGVRLRAGDIPAWNPYQLSGTPFAGHPLSGWMYAPVMVIFAFFPVLLGFKIYLAFLLLLGSISSYLYARVLGLRVVAALVAAVAFAFGPMLEWSTYTSLQFAQFAVWLPLAFLGIELAFRRDRGRRALLPLCLAAIAFSQILAGWVGEGWIYGVLLIGGYALYRGSSDPEVTSFRWKPQPLRTVLALAVALGGGTMLGAAGVLPRLAVQAQSALANVDYAAMGRDGILNPPWKAAYLMQQVLGEGDGYHFRAAQFGAPVAVLVLAALILAPKRFGTIFFIAITAAGLLLTLRWTPLLPVAYLVPGYRDLHLHDPWRAIAIVSLGPAMLSAIGVDSLLTHAGSLKRIPVVIAAGGGVAGLALVLAPDRGLIWWAPAIAAFAVTLLAVVLLLGARTDAAAFESRPRGSTLFAALILLVVFLQPTGLELSGTWLGWPHDPRWDKRLAPNAAAEQALQVQVQTTDSDGAGAVLQALQASGEPFRYIGYGDISDAQGKWSSTSYMDRRFDPDTLAILVNGRSLFLGLHDAQGYDPIQMRRYVALIHAINGRPQDYHTAFIGATGLSSPLLDLLDIEYVLVADTVPADRPELTWLAEHGTQVFQGGHVTVYRRDPQLAHAWIVHEVRSATSAEALTQIGGGAIDVHRTALVEGAAPALPEDAIATDDRVSITVYEPDHLELRTHAAIPSFLVVSELYAKGWTATVNGAREPIVLTDGAVRGVAIPAGDAIVKMTYAPSSLRWGMRISLLAVLLVAAVVVDAIWRTRTAMEFGRRSG